MALDGFFHGASMLGSLHPKARPARHGVEVVKDVSYGPRGQSQMLDVYRPSPGSRLAPTGGGLPIVLYVHGGGFRILSKDTHWVIGLLFARKGYLVFNVNYRLAPEHPFPAALEDVCAAYEWVVANARAYGGDPTRLVVAGESAGANLTSSLTLATCFSREEPFARRVFDLGVVPRAWLPYCGVLQVSEIERLRRRWPHMSEFINDRLVEVSTAYLGEDLTRHGRTLELADPLTVLESDRAPERELPPCFATCGTSDPLVADTQRLARALEMRGVQHEAHYYPGELHAFQALVWRPQARQCWQHTYRFLDRHCPL
ncbi:MAG: alpha/beta hydrolase [Deltaproteobacteria bacterium]|nr:alpha/beta hydrolase [Deltaproteobacteria bacterium]